MLRLKHALTYKVKYLLAEKYLRFSDGEIMKKNINILLAII